jgi:hypothetical protein
MPGRLPCRDLESGEIRPDCVTGAAGLLNQPRKVRRPCRQPSTAFLRFGRGRHKARLNFGDCLTYAVARLANEPLLFTGEDFTQADLAVA